MEAILAFIQEEMRSAKEINPYQDVYDTIRRISDRISQIATEAREASPTELWLHVRHAEKLIKENDLLKAEIQKVLAIILIRHNTPTLVFKREEGAQ